MSEAATIEISEKGIERITIRRPRSGKRCVESLRALLVDLEDLDFLLRARAAAPQSGPAKAHYGDGQ